MPFKLKLKKTRQYNVASKSLFVISVELLDGGVADCTLSVDSTGQECLDNVCQRQAITQPEFFGLRYVNQSQQPRWVQLERPLKRQLEKNASSHQLYLRVMYYVISGTSLITDEITRYHYFLQLKNDLIEGRMVCDMQQAVVLASYSLQAEYGNHDSERHTVEYLNNLLTFPKQMLDGGQVILSSTLAETGRLEWLTAAVIQHHTALHHMSQAMERSILGVNRTDKVRNITLLRFKTGDVEIGTKSTELKWDCTPQAQAEEAFITSCQQLRGYGQEMFSARDKDRADVTIAVCLTGITVLTDNHEPHLYRWMDITNVINRKCTFSIECQQPNRSAAYQLATPECGKYVWRLCVLQHTFYMKRQQGCQTQEPRPNFQEHNLSSSREELDMVPRASSHQPPAAPLTPAHRAHSASCLELDATQPTAPRTRALLPQYRPAPDYETAIQQKYQQQRAEAQLRYQNHPHNHNQHQLINKPYGSHPDIHRIHYPDVTRHTINNQLTNDYDYGIKYIGNNFPFAVNPNVDLNSQMHFVNVYKPPPPYPSNGLASNSTPDLAIASQALNYHRGYISSHVSGSSPDLVSTRTALSRQYLGYINNHNVINYGRPSIMPATHGTFNNLTSVLDPNPRIIIDPHHGENFQKLRDERGDIMYSMPMHRIPYQRHLVLPQQVKLNDTQEPIYENVPLPWQNERVTMRDRAQSLTTTDEIAKLNERISSHPTINQRVLPNYHVPNDTDSHYVNAQVIKGVRDNSVPKDLNMNPTRNANSNSNRDLNLNVTNLSINKENAEFENITLAVDRISLKDDKYVDETPYQSLSTHKVNSLNEDNVTWISITDCRNEGVSSKQGVNSSQNTSDSALSNSVMNSTYSTSIDLESSNTTKGSVNSSKQEKKRRRWGMFIGRAPKTSDVKSATLGRERAKSQDKEHTNKQRWSTGLPKCQPLPPSITKEAMCQLLERKMSDEQLSFAFEQIPKGRENGAEVKTALLPQHAPYNSCTTDYLPYEDNRVRLTPTPANPHGYINASHITMTVGNTQRFYVTIKVGSDKPPKLSTLPPVDQGALLWECVWQVGARIVAHVGTSPHYVPAYNASHDYGKFRVTTTLWSAAEWGVSARVNVTDAGRTRAVWTLHALERDNARHMLGFLSELNSLRLSVEAEARADPKSGVSGDNAPVAFSCDGTHAGIALAADLLVHILDNNQELDIPRTIGLLHQQRAHLVQNVSQYRLLHQILLLYLQQSRLI